MQPTRQSGSCRVEEALPVVQEVNKRAAMTLSNNYFSNNITQIWRFHLLQSFRVSGERVMVSGTWIASSLWSQKPSTCKKTLLHNMLTRVFITHCWGSSQPVVLFLSTFHGSTRCHFRHPPGCQLMYGAQWQMCNCLNFTSVLCCWFQW